MIKANSSKDEDAKSRVYGAAICTTTVRLPWFLSIGGFFNSVYEIYYPPFMRKGGMFWRKKS